MADVVVIADDLTGAADCGIAFASAGLPTLVALGDGAAPPSAQVLAVDTDTRRMPEAEAAARAAAAAERAWRAGTRVLYKKIDSTLRGNVGAEMAATLRSPAAAARPFAVFAPAFPGTGRITREGRVFVRGVPLQETEVWRDSGMRGPAEPAAMLRLAGVRAAVLPLSGVRGGPDALGRELARLASGDVDAVVCDAEEERDLRAIADAGALLGRPVLWTGSAGLARHLPPALGLRAGEERPPAVTARRRGPILTLVGSRSGVAREQARFLAAEEGVVRLDVDPRALLAGESGPAAALAAALASGRDVVASVGEGDMGLERALELATRLGELAARQAAALGGLVATGGDTARAALAALGATGIHLLGEVEPGVPLGVADLRPPLHAVTKAGAFGSAPTLSRARAVLRALAQDGAGQGWVEAMAKTDERSLVEALRQAVALAPKA